MKQALRTLLMRLPGGVTVLERMRRQSLQGLFEHYYETNNWGDAESVSGSHSTVRYTEGIRQHLPALIESFAIRRFLDAPCGDYNWFRLVSRPTNVAYLGGDIVEALVARNQNLYGDANTSFRHLDITADLLPPADVWMCRDCLFHFSDRNVWKAIQNFLRSDVKYLLTTTFPEAPENRNITTGDFRELNLELPPFRFPRPIASLDDWIEGHPVKTLALWDRDAIGRAVAHK